MGVNGCSWNVGVILFCFCLIGFEGRVGWGGVVVGVCLFFLGEWVVVGGLVVGCFVM